MPKILLVEDNSENRDMLARRLERRGYEVAIATDGVQCLAMAGAGSYSLILMDLSLPGIDGWEASQADQGRPGDEASRRGSSRPSPRGTAMSAGDRDRAVRSGCDEYETKPIDLARLVAKIEAELAMAAAA